MSITTRRISVVLLSGVLGLLAYGCRSDSPGTPQRASSQRKVSESSDSVFLVIEFAPDRADTFALELPGADTLTVLDVLKSLTARNGLTLSTKDYPMGVMIDQIGDRKNGEGGWWLYTVNRQAISEAASARKILPRDTVAVFFRPQ